MKRTTAGAALIALLAGGASAAAQEGAEAIERSVSLAQSALAANHLTDANRYAEDAYAHAVAALERGGPEGARIRTALGAAIETRASVMVEDGARAEAVRFLRIELETDRGSSTLQTQLQATLDRITLEGRPAPQVETRMHVGPRVPTVDQLRGKVVLLFFWAHWCTQCRADGPMVEGLVRKFHRRGLAIVAPTERYGYIETGQPAAPARELRHIVSVRNTHYAFLRREPVPISDANYRGYGVTTIPMYVLLDRQGIVRLYHAGRMTEEELEAAIRKLL